LGGLAEFERELIRARTHDSRERANAKGAGSARALTEHQRKEAIRGRDKAEESFAEIGRSDNSVVGPMPGPSP